MVEQLKGYTPSFSNIALGDIVYLRRRAGDNLKINHPYIVAGHQTYYKGYLIGILRYDMAYADWTNEQAFDVYDRYIIEKSARLWWVHLNDIEKIIHTTELIDVNKECENNV